MIWDFFLDYLECPGVSTDKYWFWESWARRPSPKIMNMSGFRILPNEIKKVRIQNDAEKYTELSGCLLITSTIQMTNNDQKMPQ